MAQTSQTQVMPLLVENTGVTESTQLANNAALKAKVTPNKARHQKFLAQVKSESKLTNNNEFMHEESFEFKGAHDGSNVDVEQLGKEMETILTGVMIGVK